MQILQQQSRWLTGALALVLGIAGAASATPTVLGEIPANFQGLSGGSVASDCGNISAQPSQQIQLTPAFTSRSAYLRFAVQGQGSPTLLIEGPAGRFCVLSDPSKGQGPEVAGHWLPGTYNIYVGDRANQSHPYSLSVLTE